MPSPAVPIHEYREAADLEEVNRLAVAEGYDLFLAVAVDGHVRYLLRRVREPDGNRRVGFTAPAVPLPPRPPAPTGTGPSGRPATPGPDRPAAPRR